MQLRLILELILYKIKKSLEREIGELLCSSVYTSYSYHDEDKHESMKDILTKSSDMS